MSRKRSRAAEQSSGISAARIITGGVVGLVFTMILTFSAALAIDREVLPLESSKWLGPVIITLSAFWVSFLASRRNGKKLICGLLATLFYGSAMVICGLLLFSAPMKAGRMALSLAAMLLGTFGGIVVSVLRE